MSENEQPYEVGYGKPPKNGQFSKGKSGNPKGRPKGSKNLATVVTRECRQHVRVNGPGGTHLMTKLEAAAMQLANKAAQGDIRSQREFFSLVRTSEEAVNSGVSPLTAHEMDQKVMQDILRRMKSINSDAASTSQESSKSEES
jgi:hypothetical protein